MRANYKNIHDTNDDFFLQRWRNGIRLLRPHQAARQQTTNYTVSDVLKLPFNVYFMDTDSNIQNINEQTIITCGFGSIKNAIGKTAHVAVKKETAENLIHNDRIAIKTNQVNITDDYCTRMDEVNFIALSIKFPWYNNHDKVIGVFGCSIVMGQHGTCTLAQAVSLLSKTSLLSFSSDEFGGKTIFPGLQMNEGYFSKRETDILRHLVRGKTAKEIAKILELSSRTVEHYLENIKLKMHVSSKSELIERVVDIFR